MLLLSCASTATRRALPCILLILWVGEVVVGQQPPLESIAPGWPEQLSTPPNQSLPSPSPLGDEAQRAAGQLILAVQIVGNETVSEDEVIELMRTRKDREFDPETVQKDKRRLISSGLFREVRISWQQQSTGVVVTFELLERPTIRYIRFHGDRRLGKKQLLRESGLEVGEALNSYTIQEARRKLEDLYHRSGFHAAEVLVAQGDKPGDRGVLFDISEGPLVRLWHVGFVGNGLVGSDRLLAVLRRNMLNYRPGLKVNLEEIEEDVARLTAYYRGFGYFQAEVGRRLDYDDTQSWLTINFIINEGPRYVIRNVEVIGNSQFATDDLKTQLGLDAGQFFDQAKMNRDVAALRDVYQGQGYIYADIKPQPRFLIDEPALDMVYNVSEGDQFRVGRINVRIAGEYPHTRESVVLNRLSIKPGDIVDMRELRASERRLKASQLFENNAAEGKTPKIVIITPDLKDAEHLMANRDGRAVRGQSPDRHSVRRLDLDIYVPPTHDSPGSDRR